VQLWDDADQRVAVQARVGVRLPIQTRRRRGYSRAMADPRAASPGGRRRSAPLDLRAACGRTLAGAAAVAPAVECDVLRSFSFTDVQQSDRGPNQTDAAGADRKLTPDRGHAAGTRRSSGAAPSPALAGKTCCWCASATATYTTQWRPRRRPGAVGGLQARFANILVFDHPTLACRPGSMRWTCTRRCGRSPARSTVAQPWRAGGVVVAAGGARGANEVVLVGSPLTAPAWLALPVAPGADHLATVADLLATGGGASGIAPIAAGAAGLARSSAACCPGASVPLVDAAVALVVGCVAAAPATTPRRAACLPSNGWARPASRWCRPTSSPAPTRRCGRCGTG
jgi:hypothetical protein